jgi:hypothetical protein
VQSSSKLPSDQKIVGSNPTRLQGLRYDTVYLYTQRHCVYLRTLHKKINTLKEPQIAPQPRATFLKKISG